MNKKCAFFVIVVLLSILITACSDFALSLQKNKDAVTYNLQISQTSNGTVTTSKTTEISAGDEIILAVSANQGYQLKSLTVMTLQNKDIAVAAVTKNITYKFTMPASDVTVTPAFAIETVIEDLTGSQSSPEDNGVLYKVEHYLQTLEDLETYELAAIQIKSGEAGEETSAMAKTYAGFNVLAFAQKTISENGNTVVKIFYNRKTITYTFDPNGGNWDGSTEVKTVRGLYGAVIPLDNPQRAGYNLTWDKTMPQTFEAVNLDFTASWTARTDTKYTVKTYEQNVEGGDNYTLLSTVEKTGTTDTTTTITASNKTGFDLTINQANIEGDGSTIVSIYYNRKSYTITFETNGGSPIPSQQVLYGATVQMPAEPTKDNYRFYKWYTESTFNNPFNVNTTITSAKSLYAYWIDSSITYNFQETVYKLDPGTDGTYGTSGEYVLFGDFPQSAKADDITVNESITMKMGNMTVYCGSDGNLYAKVSGSYYKVEPIKWRVLSKDQNGKAVILAENILMNCAWDSNYYQFVFTYSEIFEYLNITFLNCAFTSAAQDKIEITSIIPEGYDYYYDNYNYWNEYAADAKIFLLSRDEAFEIYGFDYSSRIRSPTAYASANGASSWWWLRSSDCDDDGDYRGADFVRNSGSSDYNNVNRNDGGVVPALSIFIEN